MQTLHRLAFRALPAMFLSATLVVACADTRSAKEKTGALCSDLERKVNEVKPIKGSDDQDDIYPRMRTQYTLLLDAEKKIKDLLGEDAEKGVPGAFFTKWQDFTRTMKKLRDTWHDPYAGLPATGGSDTLAILAVSQAKDDADFALDRLDIAAKSYGLEQCGKQIHWRIGS